VIKEKGIKAEGNNRKRPILPQRKNEKGKKKRRINKCPKSDSLEEKTSSQSHHVAKIWSNILWGRASALFVYRAKSIGS
jgi:hypothetical protein